MALRLSDERLANLNKMGDGGSVPVRGARPAVGSGLWKATIASGRATGAGVSVSSLARLSVVRDVVEVPPGARHEVLGPLGVQERVLVEGEPHLVAHICGEEAMESSVEVATGGRTGGEEGAGAGCGGLGMRACRRRTAVRLVHVIAGLLSNLDGDERNLVGRPNVAGAVVADEVVLYPFPLEERRRRAARLRWARCRRLGRCGREGSESGP